MRLSPYRTLLAAAAVVCGCTTAHALPTRVAKGCKMPMPGVRYTRLSDLQETHHDARTIAGLNARNSAISTARKILIKAKNSWANSQGSIKPNWRNTDPHAMAVFEAEVLRRLQREGYPKARIAVVPEVENPGVKNSWTWNRVFYNLGGNNP